MLNSLNGSQFEFLKTSDEQIMSASE